jgi:hypothetical protein
MIEKKKKIGETQDSVRYEKDINRYGENTKKITIFAGRIQVWAFFLHGSSCRIKRR